ncbi:HNH endonuclease [Providencia sp. PROV116]|uniref:HNH endonuclease n=1 Tax=Providencia sp. PROV116 TaxID=2949827 RepID=UPI00234B6671|nr:HNH endonuclease [Providencia sp. PROV116]
MNPYLFNAEELKIITALQSKNLSSKDMWEDNSVSDIKSRLKKHYIMEQKQKCAYCKVELHTTHGMVWDTEHIIDKDSFPQWTFESLNLCVSCKDCNQAKWNKNVIKSNNYKKFPSKDANYYIVHAHFDNYVDHIEAAVPGVTYRYKTEKGKRTIEICGLLRYHKIGDRKDIDPTLQAVLSYAANIQTPEALQNALNFLLKSVQGE